MSYVWNIFTFKAASGLYPKHVQKMFNSWGMRNGAANKKNFIFQE